MANNPITPIAFTGTVQTTAVIGQAMHMQDKIAKTNMQEHLQAHNYATSTLLLQSGTLCGDWETLYRFQLFGYTFSG